MRSRLQVCANGSESNIRVLHARLNMVGKVRLLKPTVLTPQYIVETWEWSSPYQTCLTPFPEDEITSLLHPEMLSTLKSVRGKLYDLMIIIVTEYAAGETPHGYSISPDLIRLLADINSSLEIDITRNS